MVPPPQCAEGFFSGNGGGEGGGQRQNFRLRPAMIKGLAPSMGGNGRKGGGILWSLCRGEDFRVIRRGLQVKGGVGELHIKAIQEAKYGKGGPEDTASFKKQGL